VIEPGEIYIADFDQAGPHPVIVVSRQELNGGRYALVVVCTSARFAVRRTLNNCVPFLAGQFGFTADCVAQCDNMLSIEKLQLDLASGPIGVLDEMAMRDVIKAVGYVMEPLRGPLNRVVRRRRETGR
jgi:mRNA-degrading endonuclease toxin of MazEF toxin-antitoxin module